MKITALCMTHGRPYLLNESLESWRRQIPIPGVQYEFLVVNDCPEQRLHCDLPGVRIINMVTPFTDISLKQNWAVENECGEWVAYWDDDDIWLPFRLAMSWQWQDEKAGVLAVKQSRAWYAEDNIINSRPHNLFFGSALFSRKYYLKCGGATTNQAADKTAWQALAAGCKVCIMEPLESETFFIYRWGGPGEHDSGMPGLMQRATNQDRHREFRRRTLASPLFRAGDVELVPKWEHDYEALVQQAIAEGKGNIE